MTVQAASTALEPRRLVTAIAFGAISVAALGRLAGDPLDRPKLTADGLKAWLEVTPPDVAVMTCVRLVAVLLAWYLIAASVAALACHLGRRPELADRLCPRVLTRIVVGTTLTGLAGGLVVSHRDGAPLATTPSRPIPPTFAQGTPVPDEEPIGSPPVLVWVDSEPHPQVVEAAPPDTIPPVTPDAHDDSADVGQDTSDAGDDVWVIEPGDHLWAVAAETLADRLPAAPTEQRIARYWRAVIEQNRATLVDPTNPDLVLPGQRILLPPIDT